MIKVQYKKSSFFYPFREINDFKITEQPFMEEVIQSFWPGFSYFSLTLNTVHCFRFLLFASLCMRVHVFLCAWIAPFSSIQMCIAGWQISFLQLLIWPRWVTADTCLSHAEQLTWKLMFHISNRLSLLHCRNAVRMRRGMRMCVCSSVCLCMFVYVSCMYCFFFLITLFFIFLCSDENGHAYSDNCHVLRTNILYLLGKNKM